MHHQTLTPSCILSRLATTLALLVLPCAAYALSDAAASPPMSASEPESAHTPGAHAEALRRAHRRQLQEHLEVPEEELRGTCRFESDITTLPPHGVVALTFDDGPEPGHTEAILEVLTRRKVPATFFLIAEKARVHPELVEKMLALPGAVVGNHTWSHPNFHDIPVDGQLAEIDHADALLRPQLDARPLFRYPYGNASCEANAHVRTLGYHIVGWHVDSCDWAFDGPEGLTAHEALSCGVLPAFRHDFLGHIVSGVHAHSGGIVLMHETQRNTVGNLDSLIGRLQDEGYRFTTPEAAEFDSSLR
ncbi:MAG: polysaccharide deacetylase family protein [Pseudomonadota bacterium]|nr:polysaccharide deacetylase family protein [Pseudomonadota bacterium]